MALESKKIEQIYAGKVAKNYDLSMTHFFARYKKSACDDSSLKRDDKVLVFCRGTGLDFPHILKKIGEDGAIVGVDFSTEMLNQAKEKINKGKWKNIELVKTDITKITDKIGSNFDAGVCTLGISIIPDYKTAYYNLVSHVKKNGEIIIGDMQLAPGWVGRLNPLTVFLAKRFGGTYEGHGNSKELCSLMEKELSEVRKKEFFLKAYFYCIGKTK